MFQRLDKELNSNMVLVFNNKFWNHICCDKIKVNYVSMGQEDEGLDPSFLSFNAS